MNDEYVEINGVPTRILTFGKWIEESFKPEEKELILCITGNPGLPGFYVSFATTLYNSLNKKVPIWIIGHAGHDEPLDNRNKQIPPIKGNEELFTLSGQIEHKLDFFKKFVPQDIKLHLIGHSVGAWSIIQLLKVPEIKRRVHHCYMLFPTIERMKDSAAGSRYLENISSYRANLMISFFYFIGVLPFSVRAGIVGHFIRKWQLPEAYLEDALKGLRVSALERMIVMGKDQVGNVYDLDEETIRENLDKMTFYYGTRDHWVPTSYYYDIKQKFPKIEAYLDEHNMAHAFNIKSGPLMAEIVANWIANKHPLGSLDVDKVELMVDDAQTNQSKVQLDIKF